MHDALIERARRPGLEIDERSPQFSKVGPDRHLTVSKPGTFKVTVKLSGDFGHLPRVIRFERHLGNKELDEYDRALYVLTHPTPWTVQLDEALATSVKAAMGAQRPLDESVRELLLEALARRTP